MSERLRWFKSSYSDSEGSACIEVALEWRKSTHSDSQGSNCVEVATCPHTVHVRDSKLGDGSPRFAVSSPTWAAFVAEIRDSEPERLF
ncbi:DUF397 domain-containing protein [Streptomyces sp. A3M-1-3]|uniref:DUF397 domain-containing protein n=1 Tax=Streptomyces sp. A3M-1-3 TaxID=2962044 RepID=UPI0020B8F12B|nr:DUF397 domain-containing protein [Streptomyces sp. A3M-1-3]MCP3819042.1 DUF397 domain-containing protein [Streptomyces sp. A3M-1-3]